MRSTIRLAAVLLLILPATAVAQPWWQPYERGDYDTAAGILHAMWTKMQTHGSTTLHTEYDVPEMLGRIYFEGRGVRADPVLACSFYDIAASNVMMRPFVDPDPEKLRVTRARNAVCDSLNVDMRKDAQEMLGCPKYGTDVQTYAIDATRRLRVDRLTIRFEHARHEHSGGLGLPCGSRLTHGRVSRSKQRVFFDVFFWADGTKEGERALHWRRHEILDHTIESLDGGILGQQPGAPWMPGDPPDEWINTAGS